MVHYEAERRPHGFRRFVAGVISACVTLGILGLIAVLAAVWAYQGPGPAARQGQRLLN